MPVRGQEELARKDETAAVVGGMAEKVEQMAPMGSSRHLVYFLKEGEKEAALENRLCLAQPVLFLSQRGGVVMMLGEKKLCVDSSQAGISPVGLLKPLPEVMLCPC